MWRPWRQHDTAGKSGAERAHERALDWQQCADCSYDISTGEGHRACHWYGCPILPEDLDVFCPQCNYDFYTKEGTPECHDPPDCTHAREVAPERVAAVDAWLARQAGIGSA